MKTPAHFGYVYSMKRFIGGEKVVECRLAVTHWEYDYARWAVAKKLREARADFRRFCGEVRRDA